MMETKNILFKNGKTLEVTAQEAEDLWEQVLVKLTEVFTGNLFVRVNSSSKVINLSEIVCIS